MKLFDVYQQLNLTPSRAKGTQIFDTNGKSYLDLYSGHGVVSIGHGHPKYVQYLQEQVATLGYYSNAVHNPMQEKVATLLSKASGLDDYQLFFTNSGAESNENALKVASFITGKKKVLSFKNSFHGRTSAAVAVTDNPAIQAPLNKGHEVVFTEIGNCAFVETQLATNSFAAVIIEGIQGIGGAESVSNEFFQFLETTCKKYGVMLILDEVQSGFGRSGAFFAFQYAGITPDIITMAKGMGNGFPVGGILVHPQWQPTKGMLGSTFGGSHLACAAVIAVLETILEENLLAHTKALGEYAKDALQAIPGLERVSGKGLLLGLHLKGPSAPIRKLLLEQHGIITGSASAPNCMRILPPLTIQKESISLFINTLTKLIHYEKVHLN